MVIYTSKQNKMASRTLLWIVVITEMLLDVKSLNVFKSGYNCWSMSSLQKEAEPDDLNCTTDMGIVMYWNKPPDNSFPEYTPFSVSVNFQVTGGTSYVFYSWLVDLSRDLLKPYTDGTSARTYCEAMCAASNSCCVSSVAIFGCHSKDKFCGPEYGYNSSVQKISSDLYGSILQRRWDFNIPLVKGEGEWNFYPRFLVGNLSIWLFSSSNVTTNPQCGDGICERPYEDCRNCKADCLYYQTCDLKLWEITLLFFFSIFFLSLILLALPVFLQNSVSQTN